MVFDLKGDLVFMADADLCSWEISTGFPLPRAVNMDYPPVHSLNRWYVLLWL